MAERFIIERVAGKGGMGTVLLARDVESNAKVALKLLNPTSTHVTDEQRFAREAAVLAALRHPGIVAYLGHGHTPDGQPFLAMEWLEGEDLVTRLQREGLRTSESLTLLRCVARALAHAHRQGIVHRDIKPSNLFLRGGRVEGVTLMDFGIARRVEAATMVTQVGMIIGTPQYMAPEQARGQRDIGPGADIFSLGCVLFECLTSRPPFQGDQVAALLAKILFEEAPPLRRLLPSAPESLEALVQRMLAKDPSRRFPDADALVAALDEIEAFPDGKAPARTAVPERTALTGREQQFVSVVMAAQRSAPSIEVETLNLEEASAVMSRRLLLLAALSSFGAEVERLADGTIVATVSRGASATDQAAQAARCALVLKERWPEATVALATGRGLVHDRIPVGDAIDRAIRLLGARPSQVGDGGDALGEVVLVDEVTTRLLDARFVVHQNRAGVSVLQGELGIVDEARPLLGKPTPCVGRESELSVLEMTFAACREDPGAQAVVVVAPPGTGKSRLWHELLRRLRSRSEDVEILYGRGDPMSSGSPYSLLSQAIRRLSGARDGEDLALRRDKLERCVKERVPEADAQRVVEFLGELSGAPFPEEESVKLRAARQDPRVMSDQVSRAFVDLLGAMCATRPVLLVLEDLHWGDALTVRLVDAALVALGAQPLMVLALARQEVMERFPKLWAERKVYEIRLAGLTKKASKRLVTQVLGETLPKEILTRIVEQADGNALYLEELIRAAAEGKSDELPETVLAMLQARLMRLDPKARRALRAASVFGATFWQGGVQNLLGGDRSSDAVGESMRELIEAELVERHTESRFPGEVEYGFRHALMREASYSFFAEADRALGHRLAAAYLEKLGEPDPIVLAEHYRLGNDLERAVPFYVRAATQSYENNDMDAVIVRAEQGVAAGAAGEALGALRVLELRVHGFREEWEIADRCGTEALSLLPPGSAFFFRAMNTMFVIVGTRNQPSRFAELVGRFAQAPIAPDARGTFVEAASAVVVVFSLIGARPQGRAFVQKMLAVGAPIIDHDASARGWLKYGHSTHVRMAEADPWMAMNLAQEGVDACLQAGDRQSLILVQGTLGMTHGELGDTAGAEVILRENVAAAERLRQSFLLSAAKAHLAQGLVQQINPAHLEEAKALANDVLSTSDKAVFQGRAHGTLADIFLAVSDLDRAEAEAKKASEKLAALISERFRIISILVEILLRKGSVVEARAAAEEGFAILTKVGGGGNNEGRLLLALSEARAAAGDVEGGRSALAAMLECIKARADRIPDPVVRERYWSQVPENARARALAASQEGARGDG